MKISIIGSGITGKTTGIGLNRHGNEVIFYDTNPEVLEVLENEGHRVAGSILEALQNCDIHMICVPTPLEGNSFDLSFLESAVKQVGEGIAKKNNYQAVVIRSTVVPFTTRTIVVPLLEYYCNLKMGEEYGVCYNPEFLRMAHALEDFLNPLVIVIGETDKQSGDMIAKLYASFPAPQFRTLLENAEAIKCFSNVYNAMKVSFFNELYLLAQKCGLDHEEISQAMLNSCLGIRIPEYYTKGGFPFGGSCLSKDLAASISFVKDLGLKPYLFKAVAEINKEMERRQNESHKG